MGFDWRQRVSPNGVTQQTVTTPSTGLQFALLSQGIGAAVITPLGQVSVVVPGVQVPTPNPRPDASLRQQSVPTTQL